MANGWDFTTFVMWGWDCGVLGSCRAVGDICSGMLRVRWPRADVECEDAGRGHDTVMGPPSHPYERGGGVRRLVFVVRECPR